MSVLVTNYETFDLIYKIKKEENICPICKNILVNHTFCLPIYQDENKVVIINKIELSLPYCAKCKKHYIRKNRIKKLLRKGYNINHNIKSINNKEIITAKIKENNTIYKEEMKTTNVYHKIENKSSVKKVCFNCLLERSQDCIGKKEVCEFYKPCPSYKIRKYWPTQMLFNKSRFDK